MRDPFPGVKANVMSASNFQPSLCSYCANLRKIVKLSPLPPKLSQPPTLAIS